MRWFWLPLVLAPLQACQSVAGEAPILTVNQVTDHIREFDGRVVRIKGWLEQCRGIECVLRGRDHATLSIAKGPFDRQLDEDAPADVVLLAKVDATCYSGREICLDRTPDLQVIKVERVYPATSRQQSRNL